MSDNESFDEGLDSEYEIFHDGSGEVQAPEVAPKQRKNAKTDLSKEIEIPIDSLKDIQITKKSAKAVTKKNVDRSPLQQANSRAMKEFNAEFKSNYTTIRDRIVSEMRDAGIVVDKKVTGRRNQGDASPKPRIEKNDEIEKKPQMIKLKVAQPRKKKVVEVAQEEEPQEETKKPRKKKVVEPDPYPSDTEQTEVETRRFNSPVTKRRTKKPVIEDTSASETPAPVRRAKKRIEEKLALVNQVQSTLASIQPQQHNLFPKW
jgi:hypothetical protein